MSKTKISHSNRVSTKKLKEALKLFCEDIDSTGGVTMNAKGFYSPLGDPDWLNLADSYMKACQALGRKPFVREPEE